MDFSPIIFWDVDPSKIDWEKRARFVIGRVVKYGTVEDWTKLKKHYGLKRIGSEMMNERDLDGRSLSFLSCILEIPKEKFKCYNLGPSHPTHLNF